MRHKKRRHFSLFVVSELLDGILASVVKKKVAEQEMARDGSEGTSRQVVLSLLDGLLHEVVEDRTEEDMIVEVAEDESISEIEKRNRRVAQIRAEFHLLYPSFTKEVRDHRVVKSVRKSRKVFQTPVRKSSRIQEKKIGSEDESMPLGEFEPGDEDSEVGVGDGAIVDVEQAGKEWTPEAEMNSVRTDISVATNIGGAGDREVSDGGAVVLGMAIMGVYGDEESSSVNADEELNPSVSAGDLEVADMGTAAPPIGRFACIPCEKSFRYLHIYLNFNFYAND